MEADEFLPPPQRTMDRCNLHHGRQLPNSNHQVGMVLFMNEMVGMVQSVCEIMKGMDQSARDQIRFILSVSDNKASAKTITEQKTRVARYFQSRRQNLENAAPKLP